MKFKIVILLLAVSAKFYAQNIAINSTGNSPDASALLDIDGTGKGLLIPRMTTASRPSSPATSLIIYNTTLSWFEYWNGTAWVPFLSSSSGWSTSGNTLTGTLPSTPNEWIGTTNAADFIIKTNTITQMRIRSTGTVYIANDVAIANSIAQAERFYVTDGSDRDMVNFTTTGNSFASKSVLNISSTTTDGVGSGSTKLLNLSRSGANSFASHTAYGLFSSVTNTGATSTNVAGYFSSSGGTNNYAIIVPSTGGNVGIGTTAPGSVLSVVGTAATSTAHSSFGSMQWRMKRTAGDETNAGTIDYRGFDVNALGIVGAGTGANRLIRMWEYLGINAAPSTSQALNVSGTGATYAAIFQNGNVGIGTTTPATKLDVQGTSGATLKIVDGNQAAGKVLTSNATGVASWANPAAGTMVLLYNNETSVSGFTYANTTAFTYNVVGTFSQVKVEADIENDCSGGASVSLQGWNYKIVYNGVTTRTAQLWCGDKTNNDDWMSGHVTYMGAVANGQTVKIDVINQGTAGTWYVRNFRVWGIY